MDLRYLRATRLTKSQAGSRPWSPSSRRRSAAPARAGWSRVTRRALAVPRQGPISGAGDARSPPYLGTWHRSVWPGAVVGDRWGTDRLPVVVPPVPHANERRYLESMRGARAPEGNTGRRARAELGRGSGLPGVVPDTVAGRRDPALLLFFVLAGRRRSEVIGLTARAMSPASPELSIRGPLTAWLAAAASSRDT